MVSVLTLSFLLTGTVHPNSWPRLESESLGKLTTAESHHYHPGQHDDAASNMLEAVSHAAPILLRASRPGRQHLQVSPTRPCLYAATHLVPRDFRSRLTFSSRVISKLRTAAHGAGVVTGPDDAECDNVGHEVGLGRSASARGAPFLLRPAGGLLLLHSAEFACPPPSRSCFGGSSFFQHYV
ncbi:hypothetical protein V8E53_000327 [Lactarius tabidus]